jgi:hypothetical protein
MTLLRGRAEDQVHGKATQVDPIKPTLKAPGTKGLILRCNKPLSKLLQFCFQIQHAPLHHGAGHRAEAVGHGAEVARQGERVQVDPIKPTWKAPGIKLLKLKYEI